MTTEELIAKIEAAATALAAVAADINGAKVILRADWLSGLTPAQMLAACEHYGQTYVSTASGKPWASLVAHSSPAVEVWVECEVPAQPTKSGYELLRDLAKAEPLAVQ